MISTEELLLLVIMVCVLFLTAAVIVGAIFFIRFCLTLKRMEMQLEILGKAVNASLSPAVEEFRETSSKFRELIDTLQGSVSNFAMIAMMKKVSPRIAGIKLGLDLAMKAYNNYQNLQKKHF